jgi:hypothetical protein
VRDPAHTFHMSAHHSAPPIEEDSLAMAVMRTRTTRRRIAAAIAAAAALGAGTTIPAHAARAEGKILHAGAPDAA